jgi:hypothetical protein
MPRVEAKEEGDQRLLGSAALRRVNVAGAEDRQIGQVLRHHGPSFERGKEQVFTKAGAVGVGERATRFEPIADTLERIASEHGVLVAQGTYSLGPGLLGSS